MKSSAKWRILAGAAGLLLAACGGNADDAGAAKDGVSASSVKPAKASVDANAEEVAREARGKLKCPPKLATPPRAAGLPVDDILGVRPGLTYDEAANLVLCSHELLVIGQGAGRRLEMQTYGQQIRTGFAAGFAHARVQKTTRQVMQELQDSAIARGTNRVVRDMQPGQSKWYVGTVGIPGEERVINVAREEWFEDGKFPTIAGIEAALVKKYGVPTDVYPGFNGGRGLSLHWKYDPQAQPRSNLPCVGTADPEGGSSYSQRCGLTVEARIFPPRENPDLAEYFQVGITDQNGGYERILATEQALQQLDEQRRRQEVQQAVSNADAPRL